MPSLPMQPNPKTKLIPDTIKNHEEVKADHEKAKVEQKLKHILGEYGCGDLLTQEGLLGALHHIYGLGKQEHEEKESAAPMSTTQIKPSAKSEPVQIGAGGDMGATEGVDEGIIKEYAPGDIDNGTTPSAGGAVLDKRSRDILDGAITACANAKDASGRTQALTDYCNQHKVNYNQVYNLIIRDTGADYFVKDELPGGPEFNESLIKSYTKTLKKIK